MGSLDVQTALVLKAATFLVNHIAKHEKWMFEPWTCRSSTKHIISQLERLSDSDVLSRLCLSELRIGEPRSSSFRGANRAGCYLYR